MGCISLGIHKGFQTKREGTWQDACTQCAVALPEKGVPQFSLQPRPPSLGLASMLGKAVILDLGTEGRALERKP